MFTRACLHSSGCFVCLVALAACVGEAEPTPRVITRASRGAAPDAMRRARDVSALLTDDAGVPTDARDAGTRYAAVSAILARSCAYQRCHAGPVVGGGLSLAPGSDHRAALVGVEACGYAPMALVEPYHPEQSWLMVKLTADARPLDDPYATYIYFDPPEGWDPRARRCVDQTEDGTPLFGQRMPATAPNLLPPDEIEIIRAWIAEGAPE